MELGTCELSSKVKDGCLYKQDQDSDYWLSVQLAIIKTRRPSSKCLSNVNRLAYQLFEAQTFFPKTTFPWSKLKLNDVLWAEHDHILTERIWLLWVCLTIFKLNSYATCRQYINVTFLRNNQQCLLFSILTSDINKLYKVNNDRNYTYMQKLRSVCPGSAGRVGLK